MPTHKYKSIEEEIFDSGLLDSESIVIVNLVERFLKSPEYTTLQRIHSCLVRYESLYCNAYKEINNKNEEIIDKICNGDNET